MTDWKSINLKNRDELKIENLLFNKVLIFTDAVMIFKLLINFPLKKTVT